MAMTYPTAARARQARDFANLTLWTFQGWLAMFFVAAGYAKLTEPMANLETLMIWPALVGENLVRGIGIVELVLAVGMLVPLLSWKIGRWPLLIASVGLIGLQTVMLGVHALNLHIGLSIVNLLLLAITIPKFLGRRAPR